MQRGASGSHRSDAPRCICSCPNRALKGSSDKCESLVLFKLFNHGSFLRVASKQIYMVCLLATPDEWPGYAQSIYTLGNPAHNHERFAMTATPVVPTTPVPAPTTLLISHSARPWVSAGFGLPVLGLFSLLFWIANSHGHWTASWWCGFVAAAALSLLYFGMDLVIKVTQDDHPSAAKAIGFGTAFIVGAIEIVILALNTLNFAKYFMGVASAACAAAIIGILYLLSWLSARTRTL